MVSPNDGFPADVVVRKYGGNSLATTEQIRAVAERVESVHRSDQPIVVVVLASDGPAGRAVSAGETVLGVRGDGWSVIATSGTAASTRLNDHFRLDDHLRADPEGDSDD